MLKRLLAAGALIIATSGIALAADLTGVPHIINGDAVSFGKTRVRLAGIAAPGLEQVCLDAASARWPCGVAARDELTKHVGNQPWACQTQHADHNERLLAKCTVGGEDVAKWLVHAGWAIALPQAGREYDSDEAAAKSAKAGLWAGAFIAPSEWRRRNAQAAVLGTVAVAPASRALLLHGHSSSTPPSPDCAIKGHVNRSGTCIYHVPGSRWYARVSMQPDNGDRWFCSKEDAELASCRETKR
jgi:endonuclease YncB( thermonuclease family)